MIALEIINTIAALCALQVGGMGVTVDKVRQEQESCHKYFVECLEKSNLLLTCIKNKGK